MKYKSNRYWLMKSEAEMYSISDLKKDKKVIWTEVRNYQARNMMRDLMHVGDYIFFYHSNSKPSGIYGVGKVSKVGITDPTALDSKSEYFDPKASKEKNPWACVEISFEEEFQNPVSLEAIKSNKNLSMMVVAQRGSRLSVQPVMPVEFLEVLKMAGSA